jgi:predicted RNase H-like HicB family nuclease
MTEDGGRSENQCGSAKGEKLERSLSQARFTMKSYTIVVERCPETGLYVGSVPGFAGAHTQGGSLDELRENMREVISMLLEDGEPALESEFVGTETIEVN